MSKNLELALKIAATVTGDKDLTRMADAVRDVGKGAAEADPKAEALAKELDSLSNQQKLIQELQATKREFTAQEVATAAVAAKLGALKKETNETGKPFVELAKNVDKAEQQLNEMRKELDATAKNQNRLQTALKKSGVDTRQLGAEKKRLQTDLKKTAIEAKNLGNEYLKANGRQSSFGTGVANVTSRLVAMAATYIGLNKLVTTIKDIFTTGSEFEKLDVQFTALMGSMAEGEKATEWVKQFAKNTPLQLEEASKAFVRLKAFGIDPLDGSLQAVVDQAYKLGGGFQEAEGIALALGQAWAKQKLQGEEILQLIERGVPVWDLLAASTGKNTLELQKLSEQGKLGRDVIKGLMEEMGRQSAGAAAANMSLLSGLISNAKDNLQQFYNTIATSGSMDWLKGQLEDLNKNFEQMAADGTLQEWAQGISDTLVSIGSGIKTTVTTLYDFKEVIGVVAVAWASLKVGKFFINLYSDSRKAIAGLSDLISIKKLAAAANARYSLSFAPVIAKLAAARAATIAWMTSLTGLGGLLAKTGIFAGIAYGVYEIGRLAVAWWDLRAAQKALAESEREAAISKATLSAELEKLNLQLGTNYKSTKDLFDAQDAGIVTLNESTGAWEAVDQAVKQHSNTLADYQAVWGTTADAIEEAYKRLGIASTKSLQEAAEQARIAYETIAAGNEPIEQQQAAFLKYAEAAAKAAAAAGESVPAHLQEQAAMLGLTQELDKITNKKVTAAKVTDLQSKAYSNMQRDIVQTQDAIAEYKKTLDSSTASAQDKKNASDALTKAETQLATQTKALNEIKQLEISTLAQLKLKYDEYTRQMEELDELYRNNGITAAEYLQQKDRYIQILSVIKPMLAGMKDAEQDLEQQTNFSNQSLAEQQRILEELSGSTGKATQYTSLLAQAQLALHENFNLTDKTTEQLGARVKELSSFIVQNNRVSNIWWTDLARASNQAFLREKQIINETLLIRKYTEQLSSSSVTLNDVTRITKGMRYEFSQLGDNDLAPLRSAISDAERRILSFRENLEGTVNSLRDELDRLNDDQNAIEQRRYQQQLAELQAQLQQAQTAGDKQAITSAQEALKLAKEIYAIKQAQLKDEQLAKAETTTSQQKNTTPTTTSPRQSTQTTAPTTTSTSATSASTTVRLELSLPGRTYNANMSSYDANRMLAEIERAASTSI